MVSLELREVTKRYGQQTVLHPLDLSIASGETFGLIGPSGCGKSTILRIIAGLTTQSGGRVMLGGRDVSTTLTRDRNVGMVFQSIALFPHLNVRDNIGFGLETRGVGKTERRREVERLLALVRLEGLAERYPSQLSGGQQQRIALARALAREPRLLLFDEPFSALDRNLRQDLQDEIAGLLRTTGITAVLVTHDVEEATKLCRRIAIMSNGSVVRVGTPQELFAQPQTRYCATILGMRNIVTVDRVARSDETVMIELAGQRVFLDATLVRGTLPKNADGRMVIIIDAYGQDVMISNGQSTSTSAAGLVGEIVGMRPVRGLTDVDIALRGVMRHLTLSVQSRQLVGGDGAAPRIGSSVIVKLTPEHVVFATE